MRLCWHNAWQRQSQRQSLLQLFPSPFPTQLGQVQDENVANFYSSDSRNAKKEIKITQRQNLLKEDAEKDKRESERQREWERGVKGIFKEWQSVGHNSPGLWLRRRWWAQRWHCQLISSDKKPSRHQSQR